MKRRALLALLAALCLLFSGCANVLWTVMDAATSDEKSFEQLQELFEEDFAVIDSAVRSGRASDAEALRWIRSADEDEAYIDFYCGGSGMGSQTNYTGFFYSPEDDPLALWRNSPVRWDFVETEEGWEYVEGGGDNHFLVRQLASGYFYYFMHY